MSAEITVDAAFPGGNITVESIADEHVALHQDVRDTQGDWFYWCFRARGAAGRTVRFAFTGSNVIGVRGPAVSLDGGVTWDWLGRGCVDGKAFDYRFDADASDVRFSMGMPYVQTHLEAFLARHAGNPHLAAETLCTTRKGRAAEMVRFGRKCGAAALGGERSAPEGGCTAAPIALVVTCRNHACEMMADYALEGLIEAALADDDVGEWFRENVDGLAVPFADKDGVEDGDQGKNRRPHDHGRDYGEGSIYPTVRAIKDLVPRWSANRPLVALDLHCPWIRGDLNEHIYAVASDDDAAWARSQVFSTVLEETAGGPLPYAADGNLPFGEAWNTYNGPRLSFKRWAERQPNAILTTAFELPYANAGGVAVTQETARAFGRDLAAALRAWRPNAET